MILVTGFGPFPGVPDNPTARLIAALPAAPDLRAATLPVCWSRTLPAFAALAAAAGPRAILAFGVAPNSDRIRLETSARNRRGARVDAAGAAAEDGPLDPSLPPDAVRTTRLPLDRLGAALDAAGIAWERSDDAGSYLCNALFWRLLAEPAPRAGFVHVPPAERLAPPDLACAAEALIEALRLG